MDFYFLVDRSGSMRGIKWEKAALAVQSSVQSLAEGDRAMVTLFNSGFNDFAEQPLHPQQLVADPNFRNLAQLAPDGGTELGPALRHVLEVAKAHSPARAKSLILITDAQVGNETAILQIMGAAPDFPLHCFGVDVNLNDALLLALARQQRGTFHSLNPGDDVAKAVTGLAQTIRHPVLRDLRLPDAWETAEAWLPPLYSGQVYYLSARAATRERLALIARNGEEAPARIPVASQTTSGEAPYLHWCKHRIQRYMTEHRIAEAVALSVKSNLVCTLTAFIAWDEAEKVAVASHALGQPSLMEAGALYETTFDCLSASPRRLGIFGLRSLMGRSRGTQAGWSSRLGRELAAGSGDGTPPALAADAAQDAATVVSRIVQHLRSSHAACPEEPFTIEQRRAAFVMVLEQVCSRLSHPEWEALCHQILAWAFSKPKEALLRSNQLAQLLSKLAVHLTEIGALCQRMLARVGELRRASGPGAAVLDAAERLLREKRLKLGGPTGLVALLKASPGQSNDKQIEYALAKLVEIEAAIQQQLAGFLQTVNAK